MHVCVCVCVRVWGMCVGVGEVEIYFSGQWTIGLQALEIWWSCQIYDGPDRF